MAQFKDLPRSWKQVISYSLVALASAAVTFGVCWGRNTTVNYSSNKKYSENVAKIDEAYSVIDQYFIGDADDQLMVDSAISAMIQATGDKWSYYLNAEDYKAYKAANAKQYVGIGVTVNPDPNKGFLIEKVNENGGAKKAGLQVGDYITQVDGTSVVGKDSGEVQKLIQGTEGTAVEITVLRGEETITKKVARGTITNIAVEGQMLENKIGLVTIHRFDEQSSKEAISAIENLMSQGAKGLIFDVRNNPGGYKSELVSLLDYLLPEGVLFRSEDYTGKTEEDRSDAKCLNLPMAVLMNEDSYSAAEFFAAAIAEYNWGTTVGAHTTGKGRFQVDIDLSDGSVIHLSVGRFFTPKGVDLAEAQGIAPQVEVSLTDAQKKDLAGGKLAPKDDPQVQAALQEVLKKVK